MFVEVAVVSPSVTKTKRKGFAGAQPRRGREYGAGLGRATYPEPKLTEDRRGHCEPPCPESIEAFLHLEVFVQHV